ncbi:hypothetical protein MMC30_001403 [Trapelia coarctata]|nr:hypothetical protein [Trapelia coarctata]
MNSNGANLSTVTAALKGIDGASFEAFVASDSRPPMPRISGNRQDAEFVINNQATSTIYNLYTPINQRSTKQSNAHGDIAVVDGSTLQEQSNSSAKARARRASEGAYLTKMDSKRTSGGELRCETCGKGYKHSSCLTKHLWEHTPQWSVTSKLLISKHQQVQLLEAAQVLVTMNQDLLVPDEPAKAMDSDQSSASPPASGSSDIPDDDDVSSVETTSPPLSEQADFRGDAEIHGEKRYSDNSSVFSRSYQSAPSGSVAASSVPTAASYGSFHHLSYQRRPSSSGITSLGGAAAQEEEAALAAAVELCNFNGTPRTAPLHMDDIPPVPPLPARYASHNANRSISGLGYPGMQGLGVPPTLTHRLSDERDVKMHDSQARHADDDDEYYDQRSVSRGRSDEDDDGVFGRMEE